LGGKRGPTPLYLGISVHGDGGLKQKLNKLCFQTFQVLQEEYGTDNDLEAELKKVQKCIQKDNQLHW